MRTANMPSSVAAYITVTLARGRSLPSMRVLASMAKVRVTESGPSPLRLTVMELAETAVTMPEKIAVWAESSAGGGWCAHAG